MSVSAMSVQLPDSEVELRRNCCRIRGRRGSVSAEVMPHPMHEPMADRAIPSCLETDRKMLSAVIHDHGLFTSLDEEQKTLVAEAFLVRSYCRGDTIVRQGEDGHLFYVVKSGTLSCSIRPSSTAVAIKRICSYGPNDSFGELALLYNQPRAATVVVDSEECVLWAIERKAYITILQHTNSSKKQYYLHCLATVPLLQSLEDEEIAKLIDAVQPRTYAAGEVMVKEGEAEDTLFILLQGNAVATKHTSSCGGLTLNSYAAGDFFGGMAFKLVTQQPYAATVTATVESLVCVIDKETFSRLLGPCEEIVDARAAQIQSESRGGSGTAALSLAT